jgi:hypothetical protein
MLRILVALTVAALLLPLPGVAATTALVTGFIAK